MLSLSYIYCVTLRNTLKRLYHWGYLYAEERIILKWNADGLYMTLWDVLPQSCVRPSEPSGSVGEGGGI